MGNTVCCQAKPANVTEKLPKKKVLRSASSNAEIQGQMEGSDDENFSNDTDGMNADSFMQSLESSFKAADDIKGGAPGLGRRTTLDLKKT